MRVLISLVLVSGLASCLALPGVEWNCQDDHLEPVERGTLIRQEDRSPPMTWEISDQYVEPGGSINVVLKKSTDRERESVRSFVIRAHFIGEYTPIGTWKSLDDSVSNDIKCPGLLLQAEGSTDKDLINATWTAPASLRTGQIIEFVASMARDNAYWTGFRAPMVVPRIITDVDAVGQPDAPKIDVWDDPHNQYKEADLQAAAMEKKQKEIDDEDKYSEGEWQKAEEEAKREHEKQIEWETEDYERRKQEEEQAREARIRAEILDKEEHDREENTPKPDLPKPPPEIPEDKDPNVIDIDDKPIDKTSGSSKAVFTVGAVLSVLAALLL